MPDSLPAPVAVVRSGELWKISRFQKHIGISPRLLKAWQSKGLVLKDLGSDSPFLLTDDLIQFYRDQPNPEQGDTTESKPTVGAAPLIVEDGLYVAEQLIIALQISTTTLIKWQVEGLRFCKPGTKRRYYRGRDVLAFMFKEGQIE